MPDRQGWPEWAVTRAECANCGEFGYSPKPAPPIGASHDYDRWLRTVWPAGRAQQTRIGFFIWHSRECESVWKKTRAPEIGESGWAHQHRILMDSRRVRSGLA